MNGESDFAQGCNLSPEVWAKANAEWAFQRPEVRRSVADFPPVELMQNVSGLTSERDFAAHGAHFWLALNRLSAKPLSQYASLLDLGCGCGRLGRLFKGHTGRICGCDIDARHVDFVGKTLPWIHAQLTEPDRPLPYRTREFDCVISISVFSHLTEESQDILLRELHRVTKGGGQLLLTIHGERALRRAIDETPIRDMLSMDPRLFDGAITDFNNGRHAFIRQNGHLTTSSYTYGIAFIPTEYVQKHWGKWFIVENHASGAIHDFQDVVVLRPRG